MRNNNGAPGIDKTTLAQVEEYGVDRLLEELADRLREQRYRPLPTRRVLIPKPGLKDQYRPLSITAVGDRVVQTAVKIVLEPVFEADFASCSYGFRPKRSAHDALQVLIDEQQRGRRWVVETDIADCFSAIGHQELMQAIEERICDLEVAITVGQWLQTWLAGRKGLRNGTLRSYRTHITTHLNPVVGHIRLDRLRVSDVQAVFDAIDERNEAITRARESGDHEARAQVKGARVVGPATMHRIRATLRAALNQAIRERRIDLNVASLIELPSGRRPKALVWTPERVREWSRGRETFIEVKSRVRSAGPGEKVRSGRVKPMDAYVSTPRPSPVMVWTPEQTGTFLDRAALHRLHALYHLIAFRGLRRGEACGLRWADVDLDEGTIRVRWQITQNGGRTEQGRPKSEAGERQVTLDQHTVKQ
ncbi:reverse transcriptase domain-containing protein [Actinomadura latina]|uniref:reverse transcriptase domain-containing protein n=1 Tax=Actinomadura latina TaxID=163603 RepID=UPI000AD3BAF9|nr:reverse transcriptase domain-containing protein [Actinomadura latina]